jgi:hypothetical protein
MKWLEENWTLNSFIDYVIRRVSSICRLKQKLICVIWTNIYSCILKYPPYFVMHMGIIIIRFDTNAIVDFQELLNDKNMQQLVQENP